MRILVVLVQSEGADEVAPIALEAAREGHPVTVLQLHDPRYADRLCNKLAQDGWLGTRGSEEAGLTATEEYLGRFEEACQLVRNRLTEAGVDARCMTRHGDLVNTVLRMVDELGDVGLVIVGQPHHSWLTRWYKDLNLRLLVERSPCDVRIVPLPAR